MRLVNGCPDFDAICKALKTNCCVVAEPLCHVVVQPSTFACKRVWKIVVEQRDVGLYAIFEAAINDAIVKIDTRFIHFTNPCGDDSAPRKGEAIGVLSAFFHQVDIFFVAMVKVAGHIAVNMVDVLIARVAKEIPFSKAFAVFVPGSLTLIRRRGGTPQKRHVVLVAHESPFHHSTRWIRAVDLRLR